MYLILLHRDGARAETYRGAHGDPSTHIHRQIWGWGGHVRERELGPRDHVTCYFIAQPCHVTISGRRGGGTHHIIGHVIQVSSAERCPRLVYYCPMPGKGSKYHWNMHLFSA